MCIITLALRWEGVKQYANKSLTKMIDMLES